MAPAVPRGLLSSSRGYACVRLVNQVGGVSRSFDKQHATGSIKHVQTDVSTTTAQPPHLVVARRDLLVPRVVGRERAELVQVLSGLVWGFGHRVSQAAAIPPPPLSMIPQNHPAHTRRQNDLEEEELAELLGDAHPLQRPAGRRREGGGADGPVEDVVAVVVGAFWGEGVGVRDRVGVGAGQVYTEHTPRQAYIYTPPNPTYLPPPPPRHRSPCPRPPPHSTRCRPRRRPRPQGGRASPAC